MNSKAIYSNAEKHHIIPHWFNPALNNVAMLQYLLAPLVDGGVLIDSAVSSPTGNSALKGEVTTVVDLKNISSQYTLCKTGPPCPATTGFLKKKARSQS